MPQPQDGAQASDLDFDPNALREKYRQERDKRLRPEGEEQYLEVQGALAHYSEFDPYSRSDFTREAVSDVVEVAIIGGGFSGLLAAARLKGAGVSDIRIIEAGADFGGTWYWNRYPGAQCDIDSYCYLPLLEELNYIPDNKYSYAPEIYEHSKRIGTVYGLYDCALFQTRVKEIRWDEKLRRWHISTNRNDGIKARFVITATGPASRPKLANIPGIADFKGHSFHTSRWDYDYTGGDPTGNMKELRNKRVAVIGTGATAIQCVPKIAADAEHLYVFQRTPSSVDRRNNQVTDPNWVSTLKPGWQRQRRKNFNDVVTGQPFEIDLVNDAWTDIFRNLQVMAKVGTGSSGAAANPEELTEIADFKKMNEIRARVDRIVHDARTAEALKPWYRQFCKRPTFSDEYLDTFNLPNVTLVDTSESRGVEKITETGIVAGGIEYKVDCIIFATGFEIGSSFRRRVDFDIIGLGGQSLFDYWANGMRTLHGHSSRGFPNWFFIGIGQNGLASNMTSMFDDQAQHIAYIIKSAKDRGAKTIQPTEAAENAWITEIRRQSITNRAFLEACTPGYYNNEGNFDKTASTLLGEAYAPGANAFNALLADWRSKGDLEGLEIGF